MAICKKCGAKVDDNIKFCPACGSQMTASPVQQQPQQQNANRQNLEQQFAKFNNTADSTGAYDPKDIEQNKTLALFSYLGILFIIPLISAPTSRYAKFHANQGLVLFISEIVLAIGVNIVRGIFSLIKLGFLGSLLSWVVSIASIVFMVLGIVNAVQGRAKELPIIGQIKLLK